MFSLVGYRTPTIQRGFKEAMQRLVEFGLPFQVGQMSDAINDCQRRLGNELRHEPGGCDRLAWS